MRKRVGDNGKGSVRGGGAETVQEIVSGGADEDVKFR